MMFKNKELIAATVVILLSQWGSQLWLSGQIALPPVIAGNDDLENKLGDLSALLQQRIDAQYLTAEINHGANVVTVDASSLEDTLRRIVAEELVRVTHSELVNDVGDTKNFADTDTANDMQPGEAFAISESLVLDIIQNGKVDVDQSVKIQELAHNLTQEERIKLLEQYHGAVSRGEIEISEIPFPL